MARARFAGNLICFPLAGDPQIDLGDIAICILRQAQRRRGGKQTQVSVYSADAMQMLAWISTCGIIAASPLRSTVFHPGGRQHVRLCVSVGKYERWRPAFTHGLANLGEIKSFNRAELQTCRARPFCTQHFNLARISWQFWMLDQREL